MRSAKRQNQGHARVSSSYSLAAPVLGWDAQSPIAAMKPGNAVTLDNWTPRPGYVEARRGFREQSVGLDHPVESLIIWTGGGEGNDQIFQCADGNIYDATEFGIAPGSAVYGSTVNSRIQYVNFSNDGGYWTICVNGSATPAITASNTCVCRARSSTSGADQSANRSRPASG